MTSLLTKLYCVKYKHGNKIMYRFLQATMPVELICKIEGNRPYRSHALKVYDMGVTIY
jgi:hypothetical protein